MLRSYILPEYRQHFFSRKWYPSTKPLPDLAAITKILPSTPSTSAYIIASSGQVTTVFEKDCVTSGIRSSRSFIVATNHDNVDEQISNGIGRESAVPSAPQVQARMEILMNIIAESTERQTLMEKKWHKAKQAFMKSHPGTSTDEMYVTQNELSEWLQDYPITNELTQFACIMDADRGEVVWLRRWKGFD